MKLRQAEEGDWERVVEICKNHYIPFPEFKNIMTLPVVVDDDDRIVALGFLRQFIETTFLPDLTERPRVIVKALEMLQEFAENKLVEYNADRMHAFVTDPKFKELLMKHFNYKISNGDALFFKKGG
jgi:hypothetical protein